MSEGFYRPNGGGLFGGRGMLGGSFAKGPAARPLRPAWVTALDPAALAAWDFAGDRAWRGRTLFSRSSPKLVRSAAGVWMPVATDVLPRSDLGASIEPERASPIANSGINGGTIGVIGSGGALPTGWNAGSFSVVEFVSKAVQADGLTWGRFRVVADNSAGSGILYPRFRVTPTINGLVAGEEWTVSAFMRLISMSSNVRGEGFQIMISGPAGGGDQVILQNAVAAGGPAQRRSLTRTLTSSGGTGGLVQFGTAVAAGEVQETVFEIAVPQAEKGSAATSPTSPIVSTGSAATRAADVLRLLEFAGTRLRFTFDDGSTQDVAGVSVPYLVPTNLNRPIVRNVVALAS